jgi:hypothetical protein
MQRTNKIATVNVIEINDGNVTQIVSFKDNKKGNNEAETLFVKIAQENGATDDEMDVCLESGYFGQSNDYIVCITHSS